MSLIASEFDRGLVSVIIPTRNRAGLLAQTLQSVLNQTFPRLEILVVDDGSTDETRCVIERMQPEAPDGKRIRLIRSTSQGAQAARNQGLANSNGEFIVITDDDDLFSEDLIESRVSVLAQNAALDLVYGPFIDFWQQQNATYISPVRELTSGASVDPVERFLSGWRWPVRGWVVRRSFTSKLGPWDESLDRSQDLDYKFRALTLECNAKHTPHGRLFYRHHVNSISFQVSQSKLDSTAVVLRRIEHFVANSPNYDKLRSHLCSYLTKRANLLARQGGVRQAIEVSNLARQHSTTTNLASNARLLFNVASSTALEIMRMTFRNKLKVPSDACRIACLDLSQTKNDD